MRQWVLRRLDRRLVRLKRELDRACEASDREIEALRTRLDRHYLNRREAEDLLREAVHHLAIRDDIAGDIARLLWWRSFVSDEAMSQETILSSAWWRGE